MPDASVLLIDDNTTFIRFAKRFIDADPRLSVVAAANSADEGLRLAPLHRPMFILLDLAMPGMSGFEVLPSLREAAPDTQIVILSMHDSPDYIEKALRLGAAAYVSKKTVAEDLLPLLHALID
jgi:DNA-binding NarL/FixJ family response regulator